MYSQRVIDTTIQDFSRREGWEPEFHSPEECEEFSNYITSLLEPHKNNAGTSWYWKDNKAPKADRIRWIRRWVQNEQFLCFASAEYFVTRYCHIRRADEVVVLFEFRLAQRIFLAALAECDDLQIAIQLFILKCRQVGISTATAMFFLHRILFRPNTYAIMASVQIPQSEKLKSMIDTAEKRLPFWLVPGKQSIKAKEPRWFNGSLLSVQAGGQEVGIAQGTSPSCVHISEIGDYTNPKKVLEEGLFPACHQLRSLFMVLEGTGSTATTWQKEKWDYYTENKKNGGRFTPFFIPPACAGDLYPPDDWLRANPIPAMWSPSDRTRKMRRRGELFVRSTDYLWKVLGQHWEMDKEFQWYWECLYKEAIASHSEREMLSQFAATPEDAFQSKDDPVFSAETIDIVTKGKKPDYVAYAITGKTILMGNENKPYYPNQEDIDQKAVDRGGIVHLEWQGYDDNEYRWDLIPLKQFDDTKDENCFDKLLVFSAPEDGLDIAIGIDTAHGLNTPNEDRSSLTVKRNGKGSVPDEQLAAFTSLRVNAPQMARIAAAVAALYGTDGDKNVTSSNPLVVKFIIEQVRKAGDECQSQLKIMGFLDHHIMLRIDQKGNVKQDSGHQEGWFTRQYSRPYLLDRFVDAVNTGWYILHDPIVIRQLATFMRKYKDHGYAQMEHATGAKDDNIFSNAMAWTTHHELENTAMRISSRYPIPEKEKAIVDQWCERIMVLD